MDPCLAMSRRPVKRRARYRSPPVSEFLDEQSLAMSTASDIAIAATSLAGTHAPLWDSHRHTADRLALASLSRSGPPGPPGPFTFPSR